MKVSFVVDAALKKKPLKALVDTGAGISALDYNWYMRHIARTYPMLPYDGPVVRGPNGNNIHIKGAINIKERDVVVGSYALGGDDDGEAHLVIVDGLSHNLIMGKSWIHKYVHTISVADQKLELHSGCVPFLNTHKNEPIRVCTFEPINTNNEMKDIDQDGSSAHLHTSVVVPARSHMITYIKYPWHQQVVHENDALAFEPIQHDQVLVARTLFTPQLQLHESESQEQSEENTSISNYSNNKKNYVLVPVLLTNVHEQPVELNHIQGIIEDVEICNLNVNKFKDVKQSVESSNEPLITIEKKKELLRKFVDEHNPELDEKQRDELCSVLLKYEKAIGWTSKPTNRTTAMEMKIDTGTAKPIHQKPYRISPIEQQIIDKEVKSMLDAGVIRESSSPWSSPIVLVKKKDNSIRFCIDSQFGNCQGCVSLTSD